MIKLVKIGKHKGQYQIRIQPVDPVSGKRVSWPVQYADTKRKAKQIEGKLWSRLDEGEDLSHANDIFADAFDEYIERRNNMNVWSPVTYKDWRYSAKVFHEFFNKMKIKQITVSTVIKFAHDFVKQRNVTVSRNSMIARRLSHLNSFFRDTLHKSLLPRNALQTVVFKRSDFSVQQKPYLFSENELNAIQERIKKDMSELQVSYCATRLAIWVASETGMRTQEIQALRFRNLKKLNDHYTFKIDDAWSDYTKSFNHVLKNRKKGEYRIVLPLSSDLVKNIKEYHTKQRRFLQKNGLYNKEDLIFLNLQDYRFAAEGIPLNQRSLNMMLQKICRELKIGTGQKISIYSFRHTICTKLANLPGMSYPWAAARMGHSVEMFLKNYVDVDKDKNSKMTDMWMNS